MKEKTEEEFACDMWVGTLTTTIQSTKRAVRRQAASFRTRSHIEAIYKMFHDQLNTTLAEILTTHDKIQNCTHEYGKATYELHPSMGGTLTLYARKCGACTFIEEAISSPNSPDTPEWTVGATENIDQFLGDEL